MKGKRNSHKSRSRAIPKQDETTSELTKFAIMFANMNGCEVWRQNNHATKGRTFIGRKGVADVIGFCKRSGIWIALEVKGPGDRLSGDQNDFLDSISKAGGVALVVRNSQEFTKIFLEVLREKRSLVGVIKTSRQ